jgi:hypothetical protein
VSWAIEEVGAEAFGDSRLNLRLVRLLEGLSYMPNSPPTEALEKRADLVGAYRFWNNPRVSPRAILASHAAQTAKRAEQYPVVLAVQDTTEIDETAHAATRGLGYLASPRGRGLLLHSLLAVSPQGVPLGLLRQIVWTRPLKDLGKRHQRRQRPLEEKESRRWLHGLAAAEAKLKTHPQVVVIGDRESDFFPLFAAPRAANVDLLIRVSREKRRVEHAAKYLDAALEQTPVASVVEITLPRTGNRPPRKAKLKVHWTSLEVHAPRHGPRATSVTLQFLLIEEVNAPGGVRPIRWILATTLPIRSVEEALRYVQWYAYRWRIEQFHQVFKDGCRIERLQLQEADAIRRAIATYAIVAWRVLWLTLQMRQTPETSCTTILEEAEWKVLHAKFHPHTPLPANPPTLREAVRMIARLRGFLARKGDGEPGTKTVWRGLRRLHDLAEAWTLARSYQTVPES